MLKIGKSYIIRKCGMSRLCADITINERKNILWFAVDSLQENALCVGRADAFVMALLPTAMRGGHEVICEDPISERLHYQLSDYLIPTVSSVGELYHRIRISAAFVTESYQNQRAIGTGFSGGVDSLYTILKHNKDCEYPLTHIAVFNAGVFEGKQYKRGFKESCQAAVRFAQDQELQTVFVDTNFNEILPERFLDVYSFRNLSCALALQGLFSIYLLSSGHDAANFKLDLRNSSAYDLLTVTCASTESLTFYLSGAEKKRSEKLEELTEWEHSWKWLHPCIFGTAGKCNCGQCKKCIRDQTTLYALGQLEKYKAVFDTKKYMRYLPQRMGFVRANMGNHLYDETIRLLEDRGIDIPQSAFVYEEQFRRAIRNLEEEKGK